MSWQEELQNNVTTAEELKDILSLDEESYNTIKESIETFPMSVPRYYLNLINKDDPADPIRKMAFPSNFIIPQTGVLDTSGEHSNTIMKGVQHKYRQTLLILVTECCAMYCRYCFRKRLVGVPGEETATDPSQVVEYINQHPEITNCLLTGGDSFLLSNEEIEKWLKALTPVKQLDFIRFGTRTPVTFPARINDDPQLCELLKKYNKEKQIYIITHFNHPNEITEESRKAVKNLLDAGLIIKNQTVFLKGINDDPKVLAKLLRDLTSIGVIPHYIFQCRPVKGVKADFQVPLIKARQIIDEALALQNGLGKSVDYTMSHVTGKIRIFGLDANGDMIFKYVQAKNPANIGKIFTKTLSPEDTWLDD